MSSARLLAAAALIALAGCSTMQDVRNSAPVRTAQLDANYKDATACVAYELSEQFNVNSAVFEKDRRGVVSYIQEWMGNRQPMFELTIMQANVDQQSVAEFRARKSVVGSDYWADLVWPAVQKCGHSA
jgi:hypothetical protein